MWICGGRQPQVSSLAPAVPRSRPGVSQAPQPRGVRAQASPGSGVWHSVGGPVQGPGTVAAASGRRVTVRPVEGWPVCVYTRMCMCVTLTRCLGWSPQDLGADPTLSCLVCQRVHESLLCGEKARLCPACPSVLLSRIVGCRGSWSAAQDVSAQGVLRGRLERPCLRLGRCAGRWGCECERNRQTSAPERVIAQGPGEDGTLEVLV